MSDDVSRTDARREPTDSNVGGTRRRDVLGGVAAAAGAALGLSGAVAVAGTADADDVSPDIPTCEDGCSADLYCCEEGSSGCLEYCWFCNCS